MKNLNSVKYSTINKRVEFLIEWINLVNYILFEKIIRQFNS